VTVEGLGRKFCDFLPPWASDNFGGTVNARNSNNSLGCSYLFLSSNHDEGNQEMKYHLIWKDRTSFCERRIEPEYLKEKLELVECVSCRRALSNLNSIGERFPGRDSVKKKIHFDNGRGESTCYVVNEFLQLTKDRDKVSCGLCQKLS
jgi:hypothetical protein